MTVGEREGRKVGFLEGLLVGVTVTGKLVGFPVEGLMVGAAETFMVGTVDGKVVLSY